MVQGRLVNGKRFSSEMFHGVFSVGQDYQFFASNCGRKVRLS